MDNQLYIKRDLEKMLIYETQYIEDWRKKGLPPNERRIPDRSPEMDELMGKQVFGKDAGSAKKVGYVQVAYFVKHYLGDEIFRRITWVMPNSLRNNQFVAMGIRLTEIGKAKKPGRRINEPSEEQLRELCVPGAKLVDIADKLGVSTPTLKKYMDVYGIKKPFWISYNQLYFALEKHWGIINRVINDPSISCLRNTIYARDIKDACVYHGIDIEQFKK